MKTKIFTLLFLILFPFAMMSQTIDQKLIIVTNSGVNGGSFIIDYQVKGTNLSASRTLASLNADILYDSTSLRFNGSCEWLQQISMVNGYSQNAQSNASELDNHRAIRITVTGDEVNNSPGINGYNIENQYVTFVRINFIIVNQTSNATLMIKNVTNQAGLFSNPNNLPNSFEITNIALSDPILINEAPLPVKLISFTSSVNTNKVRLTWKTATEQNNKGFEIERKYKNENWISAGFINGMGNSNTEQEYKFDDKNLNSGSYNYRIKQIDYNGNHQYHNLSETVNVGAPKNFAVSQNYPNPFNPTTKIDFEVPLDSKVNITLFDISGKEIQTLLNEKKSAGYYSVAFNAVNLSSGTYFYRISGENGDRMFSETKKMTLIK
ncbi:MAG TPA: T9SS type A sorting domain-containing protein [Ignavibacteria bacterium]